MVGIWLKRRAVLSSLKSKKENNSKIFTVSNKTDTTICLKIFSSHLSWSHTLYLTSQGETPLSWRKTLSVKDTLTYKWLAMLTPKWMLTYSIELQSFNIVLYIYLSSNFVSASSCLSFGFVTEGKNGVQLGCTIWWYELFINHSQAWTKTNTGMLRYEIDLGKDRWREDEKEGKGEGWIDLFSLGVTNW